MRERFVPLLLLFVLLGFLVPPRYVLPPTLMLPALALMVFISAFRIQPTRFQSFSVSRLVLYYLIRYFGLPALLWSVLEPIDPILAIAALLFTLAPAGAASPGVASLYGGNVALSIVLLVITSLSAPFLIPLGIKLTVARSVGVDVMQVFRSLLITIAAPLALHLPLRRVPPVATWLRENDSLFVVPTIGILVVTVIARQKSVILATPEIGALYLATAVVLFALFFVVGWTLSRGIEIGDRASYALASGVNNTAMGIVVAYLYFPPEVSIFFVAAEPAWVFGMILFKLFLDRRLPAAA